MTTREELKIGTKVEYTGKDTSEMLGACGTVSEEMYSASTVVCQWERPYRGRFYFGVYPWNVRVVRREGRNKL